MRLFVALDLAEDIREHISRFIEELRPLAPQARWVSTESLHVTLKFIGEQPDANVKDVEGALGRIAGAEFNVAVCGCGFFTTEKSARVFWAGIEAGPVLGQLAADIEMALEPLGIEREKRDFSPHLTLARLGGGSGIPGRLRGDKPNRNFATVRKHLAEMAAPEFGLMTAREFFLYRSQLSPQGSRYSKLARVPLSAGKA